MDWDVSVIARRDSCESAASDTAAGAVGAAAAVPDTSGDEALAMRLSQELNRVRNT